MFIRLFIRTTLHNKASEIVKHVVSNIPNEFIIGMNYKIEPYWKFDDTMVAEINLEISKGFDDKAKNDFLNSISDNWIFFHHDKSEALSSITMEGGCTMHYDLEMINVQFRD